MDKDAAELQTGYRQSVINIHHRAHREISIQFTVISNLLITDISHQLLH